MSSLNRCLVLALLIATLPTFGASAGQLPFNLHGAYVEGCGCKISCVCASKGMAHGCQVIGGTIIDSGSYAGTDLGKVAIIFVGGNNWVRIYIQAKDDSQFKAASALGRALYRTLGKIEAVRAAHVSLSGAGGSYSLLVDGGRVASLKTQPVLGSDKRTAITFKNYPDPVVHTMMQGRVVEGSYNDGARQFKLKASNSFFNPSFSSSGKV